MSLSQAWATPFESCSPIRRFTSHKGQRHLSGLWWSATTGGHVGFESWMERERQGRQEDIDDQSEREVRVTAVGDAAQAQDVAESDAEQRWQQLDDSIDHVAPFVGRGSGVWDRWTEGRNPMPGSDQAFAKRSLPAGRPPLSGMPSPCGRRLLRANGQPR